LFKSESCGEKGAWEQNGGRWVVVGGLLGGSGNGKVAGKSPCSSFYGNGVVVASQEEQTASRQTQGRWLRGVAKVGGAGWWVDGLGCT